MSISHLVLETDYFRWRNVELPPPNAFCVSPVFSWDGSDWKFRIACSCSEAEESWDIQMLCSDQSKSSDIYGIIPYLETAREFVRLAPTIKDSPLLKTCLENISGLKTVTLLFCMTLPSFSTSQKFQTRGEAAMQSMCLQSLSTDIGRLFGEEKHADATLKCGDSSFSVHKNILAARSEVFCTMFDHDTAEKNRPEITIGEVEEAVMKEFLQFLYSGRLGTMTMDSAVDLYRVGDKYAVTSLKELCSSYILSNLSKELVCSILLMANAVGDEELLNGAADFAIREGEFLKSGEWKDFALQHSNVAIKVCLKFMNRFH